MKKKITQAIVGIAVLAVVVVFAEGAYSNAHLKNNLSRHKITQMQMANWSNGGMFDCKYVPQNISFDHGIMDLKLDKPGDEYYGAEYRTLDYYGYGFYQVSMKPIKNNGVVSSFFTYTGPADGTIWDEIDIEFLGRDTTKVQFNYFVDGRGGHEMWYDLGFDATEAFHTYGFDWAEDHITWYVDGEPVYTATSETDAIPSTPGKIMMNVWNGVGLDDWLLPYDGKTPLHAYYDWFSWDAKN